MNNEEMITSINSVIEYIKENFIGLLLLVFVFIIIYIVDHINRFNSIYFSSPTSIPIVGTSDTIPINISKVISREKKNKKH